MGLRSVPLVRRWWFSRLSVAARRVAGLRGILSGLIVSGVSRVADTGSLGLPSYCYQRPLASILKANRADLPNKPELTNPHSAPRSNLISTFQPLFCEKPSVKSHQTPQHSRKTPRQGIPIQLNTLLRCFRSSLFYSRLFIIITQRAYFYCFLTHLRQ
jgi:hypothetical protein